jgi:hypothetical protein
MDLTLKQKEIQRIKSVADRISIVHLNFFEYEKTLVIFRFTSRPMFDSTFQFQWELCH